MDLEGGSEDFSVCPAKDHYPVCIVWSPIPLLTWVLPFVGHLGVATSEGIIHDFIGPYTINTSSKRTGFGVVTRYLPVTMDQLKVEEGNKLKRWDAAIENASKKYEGMMHNLIMNNCHSHVATALNELEYRDHTQWNTLLLIILVFFAGKNVR